MAARPEVLAVRGAQLADATAVREALLRDGFAHVPGVLDDSAIGVVNRAAAALLAAAPLEHFAAQRTTGSMLDVAGDATFDALIARADVVSLLERLGFGRDLIFSAGVVHISTEHFFRLLELFGIKSEIS